ncbi:uncharacterized protein [Dysidea avara]|uniref:uncharacterized protein isoform X2 n=1 Tax=Dysidea avara TaxID=196820 RepID=UPI003332F478
MVMNSSMMYEVKRLGVYLSGRTGPRIISPSTSNVTILAGTSITLYCTSQGSPPDTFTWRKNSGPIVQSTNITTVTHTNTSAVFRADYSIDNITTSDSGTYTCTVTNPIGTDNKAIIVVVIDAAESFHIVSNGRIVENHSVINYFSVSDMLNITCMSVLTLNSIEWIITNQTGTAQLQFSNKSDTSSLIYFTNFSDTFTSDMRCSLNNGISYKDVFITKESPFYKLLTNKSLVVPLASSPVISIIIAIYSDGTRSQQDNITNSLVLTHTSNNGDVVNVDGLEQDPVNFQLYHYTFLPVQNSSEGIYTITSAIAPLEIIIQLDIKTGSAITLTRSFSSVTLLEEDTVTLSCAPSIMEVVLLWTHNEANVVIRENIAFIPPVLNHNLIIRNATTNDSGVYTCRVALGDQSITGNITLSVVEACDNNFSGALLWMKSQWNSLVTRPCSALHHNFRTGVNIERICQNDGTWSEVDLTKCTMFKNSYPIVTVYFTVTTTKNTDTIDLTNSINKISLQIESILNTSLSNPINTTWSYTSSYKNNLTSFSISFDLPSLNSFTNTINIENILNNESIKFLPNGTSLLTGTSIKVLAFQPNSSCLCNQTGDDFVRTVCTGPSTPPCLCSSQSCTCNSPTYVGDGSVCGLDSDSDGFPDVGLDCVQPQCEEDLCPDTYSVTSNGVQSQIFCMKMDSNSDCKQEQDNLWNIIWPATSINGVARQKCPGGSEAEGLATRQCLGVDHWSTPDVSQCATVDQIRLEMRAEELRYIAQGIFVNEDRDLTQTFMPEVVEDIADELQEITNTTQPLLPNDVSSAANTLDAIIEVITVAFEEIDQTILNGAIEDVVNVLSNLLDERNDISFETMEIPMETSVGEQLLMDTEEAGILLSKTLKNTSNMTIRVANNIIIQAQLANLKMSTVQFTTSTLSFDNNTMTSVFGNMTAMMTIPTSNLQRISSKGDSIPVIFIVSRNLHLPTGERERIESVILSGQISQSRTKFADQPVYISFGIGKETKELSIVSYIGCGISIICLLFTISTLIALRKDIFNLIQHFIHLNFSIALLLGLLTFVSGVELANDYRASCLTVAVLLHYFLMSAFSWMLCEGILLFIKIHFVLYHGLLTS